MRIAFLVSKGPVSRASLRYARLAKEMLRQGHQLELLFFHRDGALLCASDAADPASLAWQSLVSESHGAVACIGSALHRNICDAAHSSQCGMDKPTLQDGIELGGLGQLATALSSMDRVISV